MTLPNGWGYQFIRVCVDRAPAHRLEAGAPMPGRARMRAWSRHRPAGAVLRAVTIVNGSTVCCVHQNQARQCAGERTLCAARDPEDDAPREVPRFAAQ